FTLVDSGFIDGTTIESNTTGISIGSLSKLSISKSHLENTSGTNISVTNAGLYSSGNFYAGATTNNDINVASGTQSVTSIADTLTSGYTNNGTGQFAVYYKMATGAGTGTGPCYEMTTTALTATCGSVGSQNFVWSGYNLIDIRQ